MSSKRVWAVKGHYFNRTGITTEHESLELALEDVGYLWEAGFGSSMRSYVVPA